MPAPSAAGHLPAITTSSCLGQHAGSLWVALGNGGAWWYPQRRRKARPTDRCISQKQTAAELVHNYLPPRRALIAAPVADAARWQLSSESPCRSLAGRSSEPVISLDRSWHEH